MHSDAPRPIPGTSKAGEPAYTRPKLPPKSVLQSYYRAVAPLLLRDAARRPLNLFRCTAGHCFFQRNRNHPASDGAFGPPVRFVAVEQKNGRTEDYLWIDDGAGLIACVEFDAVEFHGWGSLADNVERPDRIVFDLDPGEGVGFGAVKDAAATMRRALEAVGLESFAMLTGGKGIHVVVAIRPEAEWPQVRGFARSLCEALAALDPHSFTISLPKAERKGRIFLDYLRNQRTATAILPWSLRARTGAPVAVPLAWDELDGFDSASAFTIDDLPMLLRRGRSAALRRWGRGSQRLPAIA